MNPSRGGVARLVLLLTGWGFLALAAPAADQPEALEPGQRRELPLTAAANADLFTDPGSQHQRCFAADLLGNGALPALAMPPLRPGCYRANVRLKLSRTISEHVAKITFSFSVAAGGQTLVARKLPTIAFELPNVYQTFSLPFAVREAGLAPAIQVSYSYALGPGKKRPVPRVAAADGAPADNAADVMDRGATEKVEIQLERKLTELPYSIACDQAWIEGLEPFAVEGLEVDKIRYRPGETLRANGTVHNYTATPQQVTLVAEIIREMATTEEVHRQDLTVPASTALPVAFTVKLTEARWGHELRCRVMQGEALLTSAAEYFTVHDNPWAVQIGGFGGSDLPVYRAGPDGRNCPEIARGYKRNYANTTEFTFWAPDDMCDLNPPDAPYHRGQLHNLASGQATRWLIAAYHQVGVACSVYVTFLGGGGQSGYETYRRHPDWFTPDFYDVAQLDRWDRSDEGMISWPRVTARPDRAEPYRKHAEEIIRSVANFGWDAVRYDSPVIPRVGNELPPHADEYFPMVKQMVNQACPGFHWGYNDELHRSEEAMGPKSIPALVKLFSVLCEGGGMIMDEYHNNGFEAQWAYEKFAGRQVIIGRRVHAQGGHVTFCPGEPEMPTDCLYQNILILAARAHVGWTTKDEAAYADYNQFATRFAGQLWDNQARPLLDPSGRQDWWDTQGQAVKDMAARIDWGPAASRLFRPYDYAYVRPLGERRQELILHVVNKPPEKVAAYDDGRFSDPLRDLRCRVRLPAGAQVTAAWLATAEPMLTQEKLPFEVKDGGLTFSIPQVRFWSMVVAEVEGGGEWR